MFLLLCGCPPAVDDDDSAAADDDCEQASACEAEFCEPPSLRIGTGTLGFEPLPEDGTIPIWYGGGMGDCMYHLRVAAQAEDLCSTVWIDYTVTVEGSGELIWDDRRHVELAPDPDSAALAYWGLEAFLPVEWYPDDPEHADECPDDAGSSGSLADVQVLVEMAVTDHDDRSASASATLQPVCCGPIQ